MTDNSVSPGPALPGREEVRLQAAMTVGVGLAAVGVIDGLVMALHSRVSPCPSGRVFTGSHPPVCHIHPDTGLGLAIMILSALLGILVVLAAIAAIAVTRGSSVDAQATPLGSPTVPPEAP